VREDGLDDARLVDVRDDPSAPAAGTDKNIVEVNSPEEGRPIDSGAHGLDDAGTEARAR
jgi:hypothetical protein